MDLIIISCLRHTIELLLFLGSVAHRHLRIQLQRWSLQARLLLVNLLLSQACDLVHSWFLSVGIRILRLVVAVLSVSTLLLSSHHQLIEFLVSFGLGSSSFLTLNQFANVSQRFL